MIAAQRERVWMSKRKRSSECALWGAFRKGSCLYRHVCVWVLNELHKKHEVQLNRITFNNWFLNWWLIVAKNAPGCVMYAGRKEYYESEVCDSDTVLGKFGAFRTVLRAHDMCCVVNMWLYIVRISWKVRHIPNHVGGPWLYQYCINSLLHMHLLKSSAHSEPRGGDLLPVIRSGRVPY